MSSEERKRAKAIEAIRKATANLDRALLEAQPYLKSIDGVRYHHEDGSFQQFQLHITFKPVKDLPNRSQ